MFPMLGQWLLALVCVAMFTTLAVFATVAATSGIRRWQRGVDYLDETLVAALVCAVLIGLCLWADAVVIAWASGGLS